DALGEPSARVGEEAPEDPMKLSAIAIHNFRRIKEAHIQLAPASFVVGPNNAGKSSVIAAVEALLSLEKNVQPGDFYEDADGARAQEIILEGTFTGLDQGVASSRGFRGRVVGGKVTYRKRYSLTGGKPTIECHEYPSTLKTEFAGAKVVEDLIDNGIPLETIREALKKDSPTDKLPREWYLAIPEALQFDETAAANWIVNPGGFPSNVVSKLPRVLHVSSYVNAQELQATDKKYLLGECLSVLFDDLLAQSPLKDEIQKRLNDLQ